MQVMANHLEDDVPRGRSCVRGNIRGTVPDVTVAMCWGGGALPLRLGPLGAMEGAATPEWGCRSRAAIWDKRLPTWPLRVAIVAVRVWRSAMEGVDIVCTAMVGGGTSTLQRLAIAVVGRWGCWD
jgi:hypothetical protein